MTPIRPFDRTRAALAAAACLAGFMAFSTPAHADFRPGDVRHSLADIERAKQLLGYAPIVDFRAGLAETLEWYAGHKA